jgi:hypothetical protein
MTHKPSPSDITRPPALTPGEWPAVYALRLRYQQGGDVFSERELARLRFLRWLYRSGRLTA